MHVAGIAKAASASSIGQIIRRLVVASLLVATLSHHTFAVDLTWKGTASNSILDGGNWNPSAPTGVQGSNENLIFPDSTTLGSGSTTPSFDTGGILTIGGGTTVPSGITFLTDAPSYTFT